MSDGGPERALLGVRVWTLSRKWSAQRSAVRSIAWLDVGSPSVDQTANNKTADAAKDKDRNVIVRDDGIRKADEQAKQKADKPTRPAR